MKKSIKQILSLALCVLLLFGVMGIPAFAECAGIGAGEYTSLPYKCYTCIGDSVPWGYGLQDEGLDTGNVRTVGMRVAGAYPDLIGKVLEQNNNAVVYFGSSSGSRVSEFRSLLETGLGYASPYMHKGDAYALRKPERAAALYSRGSDVVEWLGKSDLVTVQAGFNDITAALVNVAYASGLIDLDTIGNIKDVNSALSYIQTALENAGSGMNMVINITNAFQREVKYIFENIDAVISEVVKASPDDADIIIVGYYNALSAFTVIPNTESLLFTLLNTAVPMLNDYYSSIADKYDNVYYVSAPDVEMFYEKGTTVADMLSDIDNVLLGIHPTAEGQKYIAKAILSKLKELNTCHREHVKTISKIGKTYGLVDVKVCSDCGEVLSYGKLSTPAATIDVPEQTISYVAKTVTSGIVHLSSKLAGRISSLFAR